VGWPEDLRISKPAVTRVADRLEALGLVRRRTDPDDRRSVLLQRTVAGSVDLSDFAAILEKSWQNRPVQGNINGGA
jgi:DNA-binding MarR family transcriptional regulator